MEVVNGGLVELGTFYAKLSKFKACHNLLDILCYGFLPDSTEN